MDLGDLPPRLTSSAAAALVSDAGLQLQRYDSKVRDLLSDVAQAAALAREHCPTPTPTVVVGVARAGAPAAAAAPHPVSEWRLVRVDEARRRCGSAWSVLTPSQKVDILLGVELDLDAAKAAEARCASQEAGGELQVARGALERGEPARGGGAQRAREQLAKQLLQQAAAAGAVAALALGVAVPTTAAGAAAAEAAASRALRLRGMQLLLRRIVATERVFVSRILQTAARVTTDSSEQLVDGVRAGFERAFQRYSDKEADEDDAVCIELQSDDGGATPVMPMAAAPADMATLPRVRPHTMHIADMVHDCDGASSQGSSPLVSSPFGRSATVLLCGGTADRAASTSHARASFALREARFAGTAGSDVAEQSPASPSSRQQSHSGMLSDPGLSPMHKRKSFPRFLR